MGEESDNMDTVWTEEKDWKTTPTMARRREENYRNELVEHGETTVRCGHDSASRIEIDSDKCIVLYCVALSLTCCAQIQFR